MENGAAAYSRRVKSQPRVSQCIASTEKRRAMKGKAVLRACQDSILVPFQLDSIAAVILGQVALQVAGIVQDPRYFDDSFVVAAVQQKMPRIPHRAASARPAAAETQVIGSGPRA